MGSKPADARGGLSSPAFTANLDELGAGSDRTWLLAMAVGLGFTLIAAYLFAFRPAGNFWAYAGLLIRASLYVTSRERLKGCGGETIFALFTLGIVAGLFELLVDYVLVHGVTSGRLVYLTGSDVVLLASPVWMPLAWACVIVELGYPAVRLYGLFRARFAPRAAAIASTLIAASGAGVTIGFYEYFAYRAGWWKYETAHAMIGPYCALYIPLGEFLMFLPILPIAAWTLNRSDRPLTAAVGGGVRFAGAIAAGYALAYLALEFGR